MEEGNIEVSPEIYFFLCRLAISKKKEFNRKELCASIEITESNSKTYNKVMKILKDNLIVPEREHTKYLPIFVDKKKLEKFLFNTSHYKLNDRFIHSTGIWSTP